MMRNRNYIRIYSQEIFLEAESKATFLIITEVRTIDYMPLRSYHFEIPKRFKWDYPIYCEEEHFYPFNPN